MIRHAMGALTSWQGEWVSNPPSEGLVSLGGHLTSPCSIASIHITSVRLIDIIVRIDTVTTSSTTAMTSKRYIYKNGVMIDADVAEQLGITGGEYIEQWMDDGELAHRVLNISPERAAEIREQYPEQSGR